MTTCSEDKAHNDHNVYILGAGFSAEAGFPLIRDFMNRMRDAAAWLEGRGQRDREIRAIEHILHFRLQAAAASYRIPLDVENVEELFSLASASGGDELAQDMTLAIAATLDFARATAPIPAEHQRFNIGVVDIPDWKKPIEWGPPPEYVKQSVSTGQSKGEWFTCPSYHVYLGVMAGYFNKGASDRRDTIITFNYDTLVEETLRSLGIPFSHGIESLTGWATREGLADAQRGRDLQVLKLHGSVSWGRTVERLAGSKEKISELPCEIVSEMDRKIVVFHDYSSLRESGHVPVLVAPTWQKSLAGYLSAVKDAVVSALSTATRVIILGYSIPATDQHFRYLLAAGLRDNISLRKVFFVNQGLADGATRKQLEERLFALFRPEHFDHGIIEMVATDVQEFLAGPREMNAESYRVRIGRPLNPPGFSWGTAPWTLFPPYRAGWTIA